MEPDAIPRCLGLTPVAMRTLYTKSELLRPEWLTRARATRDTIRLRVRIDEVESSLPGYSTPPAQSPFGSMCVAGLR